MHRTHFACMHACYALQSSDSGQSDLMRKIGSWTEKKHWARNLRRLIYKFGLTLPVPMTMLEIPVLFRGVEVVMPWPTLMPSSWASCIFSHTQGQPLLGGYTLGEVHLWQPMLEEFWKRYEVGFGKHRVYEDKRNDLSSCVPIALHGDEGRGKLRRACMVTSFQPVITDGPKGHSFLTRLLYSILPAENSSLDGETPFEQLQDALVQDLWRLYQDGVEAHKLAS